MQVSVTGRHVEITDAIRDHAMSEVERRLREFPRLVSTHMILDVQKYRQIAEIVVHGPNHMVVEAKHESNDLYASMDKAIEKAERQLRKAWDRMTERKGRKKK